jgi:hypothetical protein
VNEGNGNVGGSRGRSTEPVDYAAINAVYMSLLAGVAFAARHRAKEDPIAGIELLPLGAATFALSKAIARERIGSWVREPFVEEDDDHKPRGRRLQRAIGELVTCTRCMGAWSALGIVGLRVASPTAGRTATNVLAASAINDWLQAGFKLLCEQTNVTSKALEASAPVRARD